MEELELQKTAEKIRRTAFKMMAGCDGGHYASCFSMVEIVTALYFGGVMNISPQNPLDAQRDRFVLSKGHGAAALYAALYHAGFLTEADISCFGKAEGVLGCTTADYPQLGIEGAGGSLGHGLAFAGGIALAGMLDKRDYYTYVLMGDGECQEGTVWEAALCIASHSIRKITVIIDYNRIQAMGFVDKISSLEPFGEKWMSFGWDVSCVNGHDIDALVRALRKQPNSKKPKLVIAETIKGKGLPFLENAPDRHYQTLTAEELAVGERMLGIADEK